MKPQRVLFIDRDGTLIEEPADEQIDAFEKLRFVKGVFRNLSFIREKLDFKFVMVTNQDGLGTDSFPEDTFWPVHNFILQTLEGEGITFDDIKIDNHFPQDNHPDRKPGTGMLAEYMKDKERYDLPGSYVIGDRETDRQLAENLGCKALILDSNLTWDKIAEILYAGERTAEVRRTTKETDIHVKLNLDGTGQCDIDTGIGFFDHMLEQIGKHGLFDLSSATSEASSATASACPWTTAYVRPRSTSAAAPGLSGMPSSIANALARCLPKCSSISSRASAMQRG